MTTITIPRALLEQALTALTYQGSMGPTRRQRRTAAIEALRAELAKPNPWFADLIARPEGLAKEPAAMNAHAAWHDAPEVAALKAERDRLLAVLRIVRGKHGCGALTLPKADLERIDAAIAKAEGESA